MVLNGTKLPRLMEETSGKNLGSGRHGKVSEIVPDASRKHLQSAILGQVSLDSIIHPDGWRGYNGLVDMGYKKHFQVHPGKNEFTRGNFHINGIR